MISTLAAAVLTMPQVDRRTVRAILAGSGSVTPAGTIAGGRVRVLVESDGDVEDCKVLVYSGRKEAAERLCKLFERQEIQSARDAQGIPIYAVFETTIWAHPSADTVLPQVPDPKPTLELTVEDFPTDISDPLTITVNMIIDEMGRVTNCGAFDDRYQAFGRAACDQFVGTAFSTINDRQGNAVRYAMATTVRFSTSEPSSQ